MCLLSALCVRSCDVGWGLGCGELGLHCVFEVRVEYDFGLLVFGSR